ncbi:MAG: adenylyl-sulfate kinase [Acidobacteriota bacterium]
MPEPRSTNIARTVPHVARATREANLGQRGVTVWLTGLSASGKSTVALLVDQLLTDRGHHCCVLDGDNVRRGLNSDLGFSPEDRNENIRRIGEVAKLFATNGSIALTAFISPYRADRERNRHIHGRGDFVEVYVECPLETCEKRDPRGLYAKARSGEIPEFTGVTAPYEPPLDAEIILRTDRETEEESAARVVAYLDANGYLGAAGHASRPGLRRTGRRAGSAPSLPAR